MYKNNVRYQTINQQEAYKISKQYLFLAVQRLKIKSRLNTSLFETHSLVFLVVLRQNMSFWNPGAKFGKV